MLNKYVFKPNLHYSGCLPTAILWLSMPFRCCVIVSLSAKNPGTQERKCNQYYKILSRIMTPRMIEAQQLYKIFHACRAGVFKQIPAGQNLL